MTIGERIAFFRKTYKIKQGVFADSLNISQSHISKIENNQDKPSDKLIQKIIATWGINKEWLIYETGNILNGEESVTVTKSQCFSTINDYNKKYGDKSTEKLSSLIVKLIRLSEMTNYFVEDKTFENILVLEPILDDLQEIMLYWIKEHEKNNKLSLTAEEGRILRNEIREISELYQNRLLITIRNIYSRIIANMDCLDEYWDSELEKYDKSS